MTLSSRKRAGFLALTIVLSLAIAIGVVEILLRNLSFSNATGTGKASQRWFAEHWKPINELGFRDFSIRGKGYFSKVVFVGDSFTSGHGVLFEETYYYQTAKAFQGRANFFNIGLNGGSTRSEYQTYRQFVSNTGIRNRWVVHQYFGNDIEDHIVRPGWRPPALLAALSDYSEIANSIQNYQMINSWGRQYIEALFQAYEDTPRFEAHANDLNSLHDAMYANNSRIIFLVFPFLHSDAALARSQRYVQRIGAHFLTHCRPGSVLFDVSPLASSLPQKRRVVNMLDPHPSAELHALIARDLAEILRRGMRGDLPKGENWKGKDYLRMCPDPQT
ncbi:MAG: SGNH/GDSL hydrolase family protein [Fluviicoccus sp.]|uniref:SGNH/GDSL hydrolase family protein n=1 Tax=Fluviicoccus sp. TaxID=2003552 RepID=UPI00271E50B3|nr:SGNH/GDSL hydrolase family protein [Fluviicoccus sp.]MDO8330280.1 SGNH/GDSL hydrolase family protein [Fluviicoccus sp.]